MKRWHRIALTAVVFAAATAVAVVKRSSRVEPATTEASANASGLPRFLELGSTTCTQCKMMKEVVAELRRDYSDGLQTDFIDVAIDVQAGKDYNLSMIPTQILFDPTGKELFRHEGFLSKDAIVTTFGEFGYDLKPVPADTRASRAVAESKPGMMRRALSTLSTALEGMVLVALGASLIWGVLSVVLSPCHLASIPLIVGFINDSDKNTMTTRRAFGLASLFSLGILITIAVIGAVTAMAGRLWGDIGMVAMVPVVGIFLIMGLHLMGVVPMPIDKPGQIGMRRRGMLAAFILGLVFGIALGPCTFAFMAPVLGLVFKLGGNDPFYAAAILLAYGIGHCGVIAIAGTFTGAVQNYMNWTGESKIAGRLKRLCGVLVVLGGLFMIWKTF